MPGWLSIIVAIIAAYLFGAIPTGYWYGRLRGVDIRTLGSGNLGATNIQRVFGTPAGVAVLLVDVAKGFIAARFLSSLTPYPASDWIRVGCGFAAILGHSFTPFVGFRGGKSVAASYGMMLALAPFATLVVFLAFVAVVAATRYISAGSLVSAALFPLLIWLIGESGQNFSILLVSLVIGAVLIFRHRANIGRILNGTENRFGQRVQAAEKGSKHE
jgi:glycerol-3-phosphate acyltransferase PlsY